jgi:hypothetical protein
LLNNIQETLGKEIVPMQVEWNRLMLEMAQVGIPAISKMLNVMHEGSAKFGKWLGGTSVETMRTEELVKQALAQEDLARIFDKRLEVSRKLLDVESDLAAHVEKWGINSLMGAKERNRLQKETNELYAQQKILTDGLGKGTAAQAAKTATGTDGDGAPDDKALEAARKAQEKWDSEQQKHIDKESDAEEKRWQEIDKIREDFARDQQQRHDAEMEEMHKRRAVVIEAEYALEESRINLKRDEYQREIDLLRLTQQQELAEVSGNNEAQELLEQTHKNQMLFLTQDHEARKTEVARQGAEDRAKIHKMETDATWAMVNASMDAAQALVEIAGGEKDELKPIYIALAVMRAATSTIAAVQAAWETAGGNYYVGAALSAAAVIENVALLAGQISAISSAAHGADFVTSGPQMMLVGDNPSGREHVKVTPAENNRTFNDSGNVSINLNISGNADRQTIDYSIQQLQSFSKQYKRARYEGMLA